MRHRFKDIFVIVFCTLVFAAALKSCIVDAFKIPSESMDPTLRVGDYLLVNKFIYGARTPAKFFYISLPQFQFPKLKEVQRGDVIVFEFPGEPNEVISVRNLFLVKRCIGLPGDTIDVVNGNVRVNNLRLGFFDRANDDVPQAVVPFKGMTIALDPQKLPQWKVFIQREGSIVDIRDGKIFIDEHESYSYVVRKNYFFAIGDNINNSSDSRVWGFIPEENIIGRSMMIYWSRDAAGLRWNRIGTIIH